MNWRRGESGRADVLKFEDVPIRDVLGQSAGAYLHVIDVPRTLPSHRIRVLIGPGDAGAERSHPGFAADFDVYNSPSPGGAAAPARRDGVPARAQEPYAILIDVSDALARVGAVDRVEVTLILQGPAGPLAADKYQLHDLFITRRA